MAQLLAETGDSNLSVFRFVKMLLNVTIWQREVEVKKVTKLTLGTLLAIGLALSALVVAIVPSAREETIQTVRILIEGDPREVIISHPNDGETDVTVERALDGSVLDSAPIEIREAIRKHFPREEWENAAVIAQCESGFNPLAHNDNPGVEDSRGVWQINVRSNDDLSDLDLWSVDGNAQAARIIYSRQGWGAWKNCAAAHGIS